jgi:hypothetical protein
MQITEYKLTIEGEIGGHPVTKSLTYRGNENIIIDDSDGSVVDDKDYDDHNHTIIKFPRHILKKFMEMIE